MYAFAEMLDMTNQEWPSDDHKQVAEAVLICNPRYFTMTDLVDGASIIASIPQDCIRLVTLGDLAQMGIMVS